MGNISKGMRYQVRVIKIRFWTASARTADKIQKAAIDYRDYAMAKATEECYRMIAEAVVDMGLNEEEAGNCCA